MIPRGVYPPLGIIARPLDLYMAHATIPWKVYSH